MSNIFLVLYVLVSLLWSMYASKRQWLLYGDVHLLLTGLLNFLFAPIGILYAIFKD